MTGQTSFWIIASTAAALLGGLQAFMCPTLFDFYPDPEDCSKFYRCFWGAGYQFDCPEGTRWNHKVLTCDFAYNVDCDDGYWGDDAHYVQDNVQDHTHDYIEDHTHDYQYDYGQRDISPTDSNDADYGGGWNSAGNPRDDSNQWGDFNTWEEDHGDGGIMREEVGGSEAADNAGMVEGTHPEYNTNTGKPRVTSNQRKNINITDHIRVHIQQNNQTGIETQQTTTVTSVDKLLIDHLENLKPTEEKPDRTGSKGSFLEQKTADRSRDANVDYVYASDKDDTSKSHGRYGYYGFLGVQRSGYYAPPSQRLPFFWPFEKRK